MNTSDIRFDMEALLTVFDELMPLSNEDQKDYWLKKQREDGITITLTFSVHENRVGIIIRNSPNVSLASVHFSSCKEIRVLERQCIDILSLENGERRCFLSLMGDNILEVTA